jgi:hypothetical protein
MGTGIYGRQTTRLRGKATSDPKPTVSYHVAHTALYTRRAVMNGRTWPLSDRSAVDRAQVQSPPAAMAWMPVNGPFHSAGRWPCVLFGLPLTATSGEHRARQLPTKGCRLERVTSGPAVTLAS